MFTFRPVLPPVKVRVDRAPAGGSRSEEIERLYRARGDRMWRAVLAFAGDPEVASDAVAEAFAQVLRRGEDVRDPERWVWRAAFRIASGELKERRKRPVVETIGTYEMEEPARDLVVALGRSPRSSGGRWSCTTRPATPLGRSRGSSVRPRRPSEST